MLFNYETVTTEALTIDIYDGIETGSGSFVVEFRGDIDVDPGPEPEETSSELLQIVYYIFIIIIAVNAVGFVVYYRKYKGRFKLEDLFLIHANSFSKCPGFTMVSRTFFMYMSCSSFV